MRFIGLGANGLHPSVPITHSSSRRLQRLGRPLVRFRVISASGGESMTRRKTWMDIVMEGLRYLGGEVSNQELFEYIDDHVDLSQHG